jgi:hypothetical protein
MKPRPGAVTFRRNRFHFQLTEPKSAMIFWFFLKQRRPRRRSVRFRSLKISFETSQGKSTPPTTSSNYRSSLIVQILSSQSPPTWRSTVGRNVTFCGRVVNSHRNQGAGSIRGLVWSDPGRQFPLFQAIVYAAVAWDSLRSQITIGLTG